MEIESHISVGRRYTWNTMLGNWVKFGGKFLCYLKARSSQRHLIFPKEAHFITTSMKKGEVLRLCGGWVSIKEPLGELTKEKEVREEWMGYNQIFHLSLQNESWHLAICFNKSIYLVMYLYFIFM